MSTRASILLTSTDPNSDDPVWMYRHCDGYPSSVVPSIAAAQDLLAATDYQRTRTPYMASLLCVAGYEPARDITCADGSIYQVGATVSYRVDTGPASDAEYVYVISASAAGWHIQVRRPTRRWWDHPIMSHTRLIRRGMAAELAAMT